MTEVMKIKHVLAKDGSKAYENGKSKSCAYIMHGNSIVRVLSDGSRELVNRTSSSKVKVRKADRVVVIK